jgi:hypothetical protein
MFLATAARRNIFAAPAVETVRAPAILRSSSSNGATHTHSNRVDWTLDVEVNEIARAGCGRTTIAVRVSERGGTTVGWQQPS